MTLVSFHSHLALCALLLIPIACSKKQKSEGEGDSGTPNKEGAKIEGGSSEAESTGGPAGDGSAPEGAEAEASGMDTAEAGRTKLDIFHLGGFSAGEGLSPEKPLPAKPEVDENAPLPLKPMKRVEGLADGFCGTLGAGPVECWGKNAGQFRGGFVDVAAAGDRVCAATAHGKVECLGTKLILTLDKVKRIAGAGENFCALDFNSTAHCFNREGKPSLSAPNGLRVSYMDVGDGFACAANNEKELVCWGEVDKLALPASAPKIKDLAAGDDFVCTIGADGAVNCFGKAPELAAGTYRSIAAGFGTVCGVTPGGEAKCAGSVSETFSGEIKRIAVGKASVCVLDGSDRATCKGSSSEGQLEPPRESKPDTDKDIGVKVPKEQFDDFLKLFPEAKLPLDLTQTATFLLGDRVPVEFADLLGGDPNEYRVGYRIKAPSGANAVTLLNHKTGRYSIRTYRKDGTPVQVRTLAYHHYESDRLELVEQQKAEGIESTIKSDGTIESRSFKGSNIIHYVKRHLDGSQPISRTECPVTGTQWVDEITAGGGLKRKSADMISLPGGCSESWPFIRFAPEE